MIGYIQGEVVFSDGFELVVLTSAGIGHQIYFNHVLPEGSRASIFVSHVVKEASEELYGFKSLREKKMFELLTSVKGVGPKSAFNLIGPIGVNQIIEAINLECKSTLTKAPGIGNKAAAQMILDLSGKVNKIKMYSDKSGIPHEVKLSSSSENLLDENLSLFSNDSSEDSINTESSNILNDTIMACKELGFAEDKIIPLAQNLLNSNMISRPEQLIHLVLKEV